MGEQVEDSAGRFAMPSRLVAAVERRPLLMRWILGGPAALIAAVLIMAAMPVWLPAGAGGVDNIIYPIILAPLIRSEEHTSELQSLMRISYAVFCLKIKND